MMQCRVKQLRSCVKRLCKQGSHIRSHTYEVQLGNLTPETARHVETTSCWHKCVSRACTLRPSRAQEH